MGQAEVFELLKRRRLSGDNEYYSTEQIYKMLKSEGKGYEKASLCTNIAKLRIYGYLDIKVKALKGKNNRNNIFSAYRLRKEYL